MTEITPEQISDIIDEVIKSEGVFSDMRMNIKFVHDAIPPDFTEEELNHFPFYKRAWYIRQELLRARKMERRG